ncbi:hypothetical protein [Noviherbaspirillum denitrificans]|uniref:CopC domain-containing protein n=1 Tax=Noviherbaspirillum denitrificans TaxID=1968433 RepID=A0A254TKJ3_9BURK|nr:hypothetical protein [Noviherbaspirillum denitrificans]OWW21832.1 hypothetical protein AYR66_22385 [Noviherbaspirillum denitrificans]
MKFIKIILFCLVFPTGAFAHGDEDHSQGGAKGAGSIASLQPRIETATETFELVGQLHGDQLALFIDRFETNEPVLNASVEVEANGAKAQARFRADQGDYLVDDKALMTALARPGKHSLVFTIAASSDSDLLEGTMQVAEDDHSASHSATRRFSSSTAILLAALLAGVLAVGVVLKIRRKNSTGN